MTGLEVHLRNVVHLYPSPEGDVVALRGADLDVGAGETVSVLGPSGAGKSTILALLAGTFPPSAGEVMVGGTDIAKLDNRGLAALRATTVSLVVQGAERNLIPYATVTENLWYARQGSLQRGRDPELDPHELLEALGLAGMADLAVESLASGQRQLVALAAGIALRPGLLLLDEPTSRLDASTRDAVVDLVGRVADRYGITVVLVTHDPDVARRTGRTVTISDGRVGTEGRQGVEFVVVGRQGLVQLPRDALQVVPADSLVEVVLRDGWVELHPRREES